MRRDVKSENLLITDSAYLNLVDLDIAKIMTSNYGHTLLDTIGFVASKIFSFKCGKAVNCWQQAVLPSRFFMVKRPSEMRRMSKHRRTYIC